MSQQSNTNVSFIFLPFRFDIDKKYHRSIYNLYTDMQTLEPKWLLQTDTINYMFRFVTDKVINKDITKRQCLHFKWSEQNSNFYKSEKCACQFQILGEEMFVFSTGIGIYAFKVFIKPNAQDMYVDIRTLSGELYYLKKVNQYFKDSNGKEMSFRDIAGAHISSIISGIEESNSLFFYTDQKKNLNQRANVLSLAMLPGSLNDDGDSFGSDLLRDMYHYRYCYNDQFHYSHDEQQEKQELLSLSREIIWGVSDEAMVAAAYPEMYADSEDFIRVRFYNNFNTNYLFMYVFLLHQKFTLYQFLTELGGKYSEGLDGLQEYSSKLYRFETDFEYSRIADVPQYERLYEMQVKALEIPQLFKDVREPLEALRREKEQIHEQQQSDRENKMNRMLACVGLLAIFSAWVDSFDFIDKFLNLLHIPIICIVILQFAVVAIILCIAVFVVREFLTMIRKDGHKKK